jgi:hypothetical protein
MALSACYRVNSPSVINETIDDESVIINLYEGYYYSLDDVGSIIWEAVSLGHLVDDVVRLIKNQYQDDAGVIEACVHELIAELEREQLIVPDNHDGRLYVPESNQDPRPFAKPVLNKFSDMQDLLLLDPIHEVDEKGWPFSDK